MISQSACTDGLGVPSAWIATFQAQRATPVPFSTTSAKEKLAATRVPETTGAVKRTLSNP